MATLAGYGKLLLDLKPRPIRSAADYRRVLKQLDDLMEPNPPRERGMMIELLAALVGQYESIHHPVKQRLTPAEYIAELIETRDLSQADVSRGSGVPRSVLSNVLAGRRSVSKATAAALARFFRVPINGFLDEGE
jgi:HTH-type transcriptional regulator/antitoxin HigA